jgi:hypothetical protein
MMIMVITKNAAFLICSTDLRYLEGAQDRGNSEIVKKGFIYMSDDFDLFRHKDHHDRGYGRHGHGHHLMYLDLAKSIFENKTLLFIAIVVLCIIVVIGIWLISLLVPLLGQVLSLVEKQGLKGAFEVISPYLMKLWEGAGKLGAD